MFTTGRRESLRATLIERARADQQVIAAATLGSAARDALDDYSDIDFALCCADGLDIGEVADDWTAWIRSCDAVIDTLDIHAGGGLYRVFLLADTLQVDLSFFGSDHFRPVGGEPMRIEYDVREGQNPTTQAKAPTSTEYWRTSARMAWLYLLHARSALHRDRLWQCELMLGDVRAELLSMAARRNDLNHSHGRGAHLLPTPVTTSLADARAVSVTEDELRRSIAATIDCYLTEVTHWDPAYAATLAPTLSQLTH